MLHMFSHKLLKLAKSSLTSSATAIASATSKLKMPIS